MAYADTCSGAGALQESLNRFATRVCGEGLQVEHHQVRGCPAGCSRELERGHRVTFETWSTGGEHLLCEHGQLGGDGGQRKRRVARAHQRQLDRGGIARALGCQHGAVTVAVKFGQLSRLPTQIVGTRTDPSHPVGRRDIGATSFGIDASSRRHGATSFGIDATSLGHARRHLDQRRRKGGRPPAAGAAPRRRGRSGDLVEELFEGQTWHRHPLAFSSLDSEQANDASVAVDIDLVRRG